MGAPGRGTYHAARHGVLGFTKSAALEYAAKGIRINAVCPGIIHTPMADQMMATQADALDAMLRRLDGFYLWAPGPKSSWRCSDKRCRTFTRFSEITLLGFTRSVPERTGVVETRNWPVVGS